MPNAVIYTIGHSTHKSSVLIAMLCSHNIAEIVDVRSSPYSKYNPQYNREALKSTLSENGLAYSYMGDGLGGRTDDPNCLTDGRVDYTKLSERKGFQQTINALLQIGESRKTVLLCSEQDPLHCHRTLLVAKELVKRGASVEHILATGEIETHYNAMKRLLNIFRTHNTDIFKSEEEQIADAIKMQEERIAYRIELEADHLPGGQR